jgi:hypothetical protein
MCEAIKREDIQGSYVLVTDSQELDCVLAFLGIVEFAEYVTGALVRLGDGDYDSVYLTEDAKPYSRATWWNEPYFFADSAPDELELQDVRPHKIQVNGEKTWVSDRALDKLNSLDAVPPDVCGREEPYKPHYVCTRNRGHVGPHVAHELDYASDSALTCAVWR